MTPEELYADRMDRFLGLGAYQKQPQVKIVSAIFEPDQEVFEIPRADWSKERGYE